MLWDRGTWTPKGDPHEGLEKGQLKFELHGERLKGGFSLVRLRSREKEKRESWLLVKERDERADRSSDPIRKSTKSVATGRAFEEIAAGTMSGARRKAEAAPSRNRRARSGVARRKRLPMPRFRPPQLAVLSTTPPSGPDWLHEIKFDGYRVLAAMAGGSAKLYTRSGLDWTEKFRGVAEAVAQLPARGALIDGEVVALDENGRTDFGRLQRALDSGGETLRYYAFDLLELDGEDLAGLPLVERKQRLAALLHDAPDVILYSDHIIGDGREILEQTCRMGLEGYRVEAGGEALYLAARGGVDQVEMLGTRRIRRRRVWRPSTKKERPLSSLLLGEFEDGKLRCRGRVGTGFDEPRLVAEIAYAERTADGYLRHPSFIGLREDKPASQVKAPEAMKNDAIPKREDPATSSPATRLTHPDRLLFPGAGVTKAELAAYWRRVAPLALPHIRGRPLSLVRCPEGSGQGCFFQRHHTRGMPPALLPAPLRDSEGQLEEFLKIEDVAGLEAAAQIGALELHIWGSRVSTVETPDRLVFDLDPDPSVPFAEVKRAARDFRALLEAAALETFPLLTGGKGIHVVAPLLPRLSWSELKSFARGVATRLATDDPERFTAKMAKARRKGKVYIDYLRNERGASAIAPYSPRARETPSVATPVSWTELTRIERADAYAMDTIPRRLDSLRGDPWAGYFDLRQEISPAALRMFP